MPKHRAPDVVIDSGMTEDGFVPVDSATLATRFPRGVCGRRRHDRGRAQGGGVRRGRRARGRQVADRAESAAASSRTPYDGRGVCYIEFGAGRVGRVEVDFLSGPKPTGAFGEPTDAGVIDKQRFGSTRRARWFGR